MIYEPEDTPNGIKTFTTERILAVVSQKYCRPVPRRSVLACAAEREIVRASPDACSASRDRRFSFL